MFSAEEEYNKENGKDLVKDIGRSKDESKYKRKEKDPLKMVPMSPLSEKDEPEKEDKA